MKKVSFIIPCYNEEESLPILYQKLNNVSNQLDDYESEFIFINDGSKDKTEEIIENLNKKDNRVKLFSFSRNFGQYEAINCGILYATGDLAITIDCDLQDPPELALDMIRLYENKNINIVYCSRISRKENIIKRFCSVIFYKIIGHISGIKFESDNNSEFRLIDRAVMDCYNRFNERTKYIKLILNLTGFEKIALRYKQNERIAGKTKYSYWKLLKLALSIIFSYSRNLINIFIYSGLSLIFISTIALGILLYLKYGGHIIESIYYFIIFIFMVLGFQFVSFYIIGQYILNIYEEIKNRPRFIIKKRIW